MGEDAQEHGQAAYMKYTQLPNGLKVAHVNPGETAMLYRRIFSDRCYMRHGITINPGDLVMDVGANIGMASLFFSQEYPGTSVYAYEPAPVTFSALAENARLHDIHGGVRRVALGAAPGTASFTYYPNTTVMSGLHADADKDAAVTKEFLRKTGFEASDIDEVLAEKYDRQVFETELTTLSREIANKGIDSVDLLKLDVEKSEISVLRGIAEADWPRIRQIVAEVHDIDGRLAEFTGMLRSRGFQVATEQEELLKGTEMHAAFAVRPPGHDVSRHQDSFGHRGGSRDFAEG
jgi:FkbM family methyltransferase